jgi:hypothetical protein
MRLTFWQQFSSNHSASFTIVGTFDTPEHAAHAADAARTILYRVAAYWQSLSAAEKNITLVSVVQDGELTLVEEQLRQAYGIEWSSGLDWVIDNPDLLARAVQVYGRHVFMENTDQTWNGSEPFEALWKKLGGQVLGSYQGTQDRIQVTVTCRAPDEDTAKQIWDDTHVDERRDGLQDVRIADTFYATARRIARDGLKLIYEFDDLSDLPEAFPQFIGYLEARGCTDIWYAFAQGHD